MDTVINSKRILFTGQHWPGANTIYLANAMQQHGIIVRWLNESSIFPNWSTKLGKLTRRLLMPLLIREWNEQFVRVFNSFKPHLVYIGAGHFCSAESIRTVQATSTPIMCFYPDVRWKRAGSLFSSNLSLYDLIATTRTWQKDEFLKAGAKAVLVTRFGYEPTVHRPVLASTELEAEFGANITFIGTNELHRRQDLYYWLTQDQSSNFKLWGGGWDRLDANSPILPYWQKRAVYEQEIPIIYSTSKLALHWVGWDPHGPDDQMKKGDQHNSRTFQIAACGGAMMLAQRTEEHQSFFEEGVEAEFFADSTELVDKIRYWQSPRLESKRIAVVEQALRRCRTSDYSYIPVAREYLNYFGLLK